MTEQVICVSNDKDLLQLTGWHYNFVNKTLVLVSPLEGLRTFYKQLILGDKSDNIPGFDGAMRGSCPKFIEKLQAPIDSMTEEIDMYNHVFGVYFDAQGNDDIETIMHRNAQLLHILKEEEGFWTAPGTPV
jgi:5'-3' exonuclease